MSELCLTLICSRDLEEKLLDMLLIDSAVTLFTSAATAAHGASVNRLSATEQVLGRALATQIQVIFTAENQEALLGRLRQQFAGTGLRYWISPILEHGEFS